MTRISQLPTAVTIDGTELVPVVQGGATRAATTSALATYARAALGIVACAPPSGTATTDITNISAALNAGAIVLLQPGTYQAYNVLVPNNRRIIIPPTTTVAYPDNYATGSGPYRIFTATAPGTNITFEGGGTIDGNRRGGNHGTSENILGIDMADALRLTVTGLRFYNFRSEGIYVGHSTTVPQSIHVTNNRFEDCGVKESGDSGNPRQGVAFIAGNDLLIAGNTFDTIGAYAVDCEGNGTGDTFDNVVIGPNTYRACVQGPVNVTSPGTVSNVQILDRVAAGSLGIPNPFYKPPALHNVQAIIRTSGDLTLTPGDTAWHDVPTIAALTLKGVRAGDWVRVNAMGVWDGANTFRQLDVASIVSGSPVTYWSMNSGTPGAGVPAWRGTPATVTYFGGPLMRQVTTSDIATDGTLTLRLRYSLNAVTTTVLYASAASTLALHFSAENLGATP